MNHLKYIAVILLLCACGSRQTADLKKEAPAFNFDGNEQQLLSGGSCGYCINTDSIGSQSRYISLHRDYYDRRPIISKPLCVAFAFRSRGNMQNREINIEKVPKGYGVVATTIPVHSILQITVLDSIFAANISGNSMHIEKLPLDSLNSYIEDLYMNEPDTSRYGAKIVRFNFLDDDIRAAGKCLSQLVMGYINAQRRVCLLQFNKPLQQATAGELQELRTLRPLRFSLQRDLQSLDSRF